MKQEVEYHRLFAKAHLALRGEGDARETASQLFEFLRRERNTYHFFPAVELIGDLSVVGGDYANAAKYYQQLSKAPWPDYQMRSFVLIGDALRLQGDHAGALRQYDQALGLPANEPLAIRQQTLSRIGRAACVAETGSAAEAQRELEDVIAKNDPSDEELFAQAYLALGTAYRKADQSMDAVLAYLHIDLLFYSQRTAHAEALYRLTELWPKVEQPARAVETRQLLLARYPGTVWAKRANQ
jgi:tetratricopeptide (TPR) repeat protein